jgi:ABC-type lipoprotein release transport system permease subunit
MKAIGGKPSAICKQFVLEAILIATLGWVVAMTVTPGISRPVNRIFGNALIQYPFDYTSDLTAALATLAAAVAVAVLSCLSQLRAATRMSVHEALRSE